MKIAVAMSGGVDSSVAALILVRQGHEVLGLTMVVELPCSSQADDAMSCCGPSAVRAAERVASDLGISHRVVTLSDVFEREVVSPFVREYARGRTPNPCVRCNEAVKFGALAERALELGAEAVATGHHARILRDEADGPLLARARDLDKDQSYFLYSLTRGQLSLALLPVGELTKDEVRDLARGAGLHTARRPESQDVCFLPEGGMPGLMRERAPGACVPGPILDAQGTVVGQHDGVGLYTIGQRRGLGLSRPNPVYVTAIDASRNAISVGSGQELLSTSVEADDARWSDRAGVREFRADAKVRSTATAAPCSVQRDGRSVRVIFDEPQRAVCPGQAVVFYDGDIVLGGATVVAATDPSAR